MIPSLIHIGEVIVGVIIAFVLMFLTRGWFILLLAVSLSGCGIGRYTSNTRATYKVTDSTGVIHEFSYDSDKNQELLVELVKKDDRVTGLKVAVRSETSEMALSAMAKMQSALADLLEKLMPLIAKGAAAGS